MRECICELIVHPSHTHEHITQHTGAPHLPHHHHQQQQQLQQHHASVHSTFNQSEQQTGERARIHFNRSAWHEHSRNDAPVRMAVVPGLGSTSCPASSGFLLIET